MNSDTGIRKSHSTVRHREHDYDYNRELPGAAESEMEALIDRLRQDMVPDRRLINEHIDLQRWDADCMDTADVWEAQQFFLLNHAQSCIQRLLVDLESDWRVDTARDAIRAVGMIALRVVGESEIPLDSKPVNLSLARALLACCDTNRFVSNEELHAEKVCCEH